MNKKRITLATIKSFVKKNRSNLLISVRTRFDGMTDCVQSTGNKEFRPATFNEHGSMMQNTLGINGAWFVLGSSDMFTPFETETVTGFEIYNCCGCFLLAIPKNPQ